MGSSTIAILAAALLAVAFAGGLVWASRMRARTLRAEAESARHFGLSLDLICVVGPEGRIERVNPAFERALGYTEDELAGRPLADLVHPEDRDRPLERRGRWFDKDGGTRFLEWNSAPLPEGRVYAAACDVTGSLGLEGELERIAQRDPLTGLYNRRRFDEELTARLIDARRYERGGALLLIDLERFKRVNERLGRAAGDHALREVARVLDENTRGSDAVARDTDGMVARVGGDEFAILLSEVGPVEAAAVGERLVTALEETPIEVEGGRVPLAANVGVAPYDGRHAVSAEELLARAMYVVKTPGAEPA